MRLTLILLLLMIATMSAAGENVLSISHNLEPRMQTGAYAATVRITDSAGGLVDIDYMKCEVTDPYAMKTTIDFQRVGLGTYQASIDFSRANQYYLKFVPYKMGFTFTGIETQVYAINPQKNTLNPSNYVFPLAIVVVILGIIFVNPLALLKGGQIKTESITWRNPLILAIIACVSIIVLVSVIPSFPTIFAAVEYGREDILTKNGLPAFKSGSVVPTQKIPNLDMQRILDVCPSCFNGALGEWCNPRVMTPPVTYANTIYRCVASGQEYIFYDDGGGYTTGIVKTTCDFGVSTGGCLQPPNMVITVPTTTFNLSSVPRISVPIRVRMDDGTPIAGARVIASLNNDTQAGYTDTSGTFTAVFENPKTGQSVLEATVSHPTLNLTKQYYAGITVNMPSIYATVDQTTFNLLRSTEVSIPLTVRYGTGQPADKAKVDISLDTGETVSGYTDAYGRFTAKFLNPPLGTHTLRVSASSGIISFTQDTRVFISVAEVGLTARTTSISVVKGDPVLVEVEYFTGDGTGVGGSTISGQIIDINLVAVASNAMAVTDSQGRATLRFYDIAKAGQYLLQIQAAHPLTGQSMTSSSYLAVAWVPLYTVEFESQTVLYYGYPIIMGLAVRDENNNIVDYNIEDMDATASIGGITYTPIITKKGFGLFDLRIDNPQTGNIEITVKLLGGRNSTFNGQVIKPSIQATSNLPLEMSPGRRTMEVQTRGADNTPAEADAVSAQIKRPSGTAETILLERIALGTYGANYNFDETGRYTITLTVKKAAYTDYVSTIHTDVGLSGTSAVGWVVYLVYAAAGMVILLIAYAIYKKAHPQ